MKVLKPMFLLIKYSVPAQYWSREQNCLELKFECQLFQISEAVIKRCPVKRCSLTSDAVFNLKLQAKRFATLLKRGSGIGGFLRILQKF